MSTKDDSTPSNPYRSFLAAAVCLLLGLLLTAGLDGYRDLAKARDYEEALERQIAETEQRIEHLSDRIQRIQRDPATLERLAREDLGLVRRGDVVIVLPEE